MKKTKAKVKHEKHEKVNDDVRRHIEQLPDDQWEYGDELEDMYRWTDMLIDEFELDIPLPILGMKKLRKNRYGQYLQDRNEHGLNYQVLFNLIYRDKRNEWQYIGTLFHQLLHVWQHINGDPPKNRFHNKEYIVKAAEYGLIVDRKGYTKFEEGLFTKFLEENGVEVEVEGIGKLKNYVI